MYYTIFFENCVYDKLHGHCVKSRSGAVKVINEYIIRNNINSNLITKNIVDNWLSHKVKSKKWNWIIMCPHYNKSDSIPYIYNTNYSSSSLSSQKHLLNL
jgi:hypothetical protein